jgi:hypothetical protein
MCVIWIFIFSTFIVTKGKNRTRVSEMILVRFLLQGLLLWPAPPSLSGLQKQNKELAFAAN